VSIKVPTLFIGGANMILGATLLMFEQALQRNCEIVMDVLTNR
jgi:hypothetical protein